MFKMNIFFFFFYFFKINFFFEKKKIIKINCAISLQVIHYLFFIWNDCDSSRKIIKLN